MRTHRVQPVLRPAQALVAVLGVALFVLLGMLGMHLHETPSTGAFLSANAVSQSTEHRSTVWNAGAAAESHGAFALDAGTPLDTGAGEPVPGNGGGLGELEMATACMLALLVTMVLLAPRVWRISARRSPARGAAGTAWARALGSAAPARSLFVLLSISRT